MHLVEGHHNLVVGQLQDKKDQWDKDQEHHKHLVVEQLRDKRDRWDKDQGQDQEQVQVQEFLGQQRQSVLVEEQERQLQQ